MMRLPDIIRRMTRKLFARPARTNPSEANRFRPRAEPLEDRTVPTTVTIAAIANVTEGNGITPVFQLTRDNTSGSLMVNVSTSSPSGTASSGSDYTITPLFAFFNNGVATANVSVWPSDDGTSEPTETVIATVTSGTGYTPGSPSSATINILDNDAQVVSVAKENDAVEGGTNGKFRVSRIGNLSSSLPVNISSTGGTATSGTDFTALSSSVTIAAGQAYVDVAVVALHDGIDDADETVTVTVTSGSGYTPGSPTNASLEIIDTDTDPTAFDGWATVSVNDEVEVDVLELATDLDEDELTVTAVTQGADGTVVNNLDGTVTYTPDTDFVGEDSFTYTVEDPFGNDSTATITVTITAPIAPPTSLWTATNTAVTVEVLEMAFDPDEDELTVTAVTQGTYGTVVINVDDTITYTPNTSYTGEDSFTYTVEDPDGNEATNTITVTVGPIDPVALDEEVATAVNTPVVIDSEDVAFDPAGDTLEVISVTQGTYGTVVNNLDGTFTYTPNTSYTGTDTFTYTVEDDNSNTSVGTITVVVGAPAPTEWDEIINDLEDIESELENYDQDTPDTILAALPGIVYQINSYVAEVTSFISTNNIDIIGANQSYADYVGIMSTLRKELFPNYMKQLDTLSTLRTVGLLNKSVILSLRTQLAAEKNDPVPNKTTIALLQYAMDQLVLAQVSIIDEYRTIHNVARKSRETILRLQAVTLQGFPLVVQQFLTPPELPSLQGVSDEMFPK